jgi:threonine dehydrogenase-like Zn-dependent dehydrogenase
LPHRNPPDAPICDRACWIGPADEGSNPVNFPSTTVCCVLTGPRRLELRELPVPPVEPDSGLLRVDATGVCGSDVGFFGSDLSPRVLGHEVVGTIAALGRGAEERWGAREGDRVLLEEYLPCGHCAFCRTADYRLCPASDVNATPGALRYGSTPLSVPPALWGGYSEYMYLHPRTIMHVLRPSIPSARAPLALPIGNGFEWAVREGGTGPGSVVLIMGPGQQGLGCVIAAKEAGAASVIVSGLRQDKHRLEVARQLGADHTLVADDGTDLVAALAGLTGGELPDVVIDTAAGSETTLGAALDAVRKRGVIVMPASVHRPLGNVAFYKLRQKHVTLKGVRGHSFQAVERAIDVIGRGHPGIHAMSSLTVGLGDVETAIRGTAGELDQPVIHAVVIPDARDGGRAVAAQHPLEV